VLVVRLGAGGHIQQLQRLGNVERDRIGQRAGAGQKPDPLALDQFADAAGWVLAVAGQHEAVLVVRLGTGGHIQQLQRLGNVERDQTGQRAGAGQDLAQLADVAGWVLVVAGLHEVALVAGLGVGAVAGSTAAGEHQEERHGIDQAGTSSSGSAWRRPGYRPSVALLHPWGRRGQCRSRTGLPALATGAPECQRLRVKAQRHGRLECHSRRAPACAPGDLFA
jgi:hypothetical protein